MGVNGFRFEPLGFLLFTIALPIFFFGQHDLFLSLVALIFLRSLFFYICILFFSVMFFMKFVFVQDWIVLRYCVPMLRFFLVAGVVASTLPVFSRDNYPAPDRILSSIILVCAIVSFVGIFYPQYYLGVSYFFTTPSFAPMGDETDYAVAVAAFAGGRVSSIFPQPATAGLFWFCSFVSWFALQRSGHPFRGIDLIVLSMIAFGGIVSGSKVFFGGIILFVFFLLIFFSFSERRFARCFFIIMSVVPTFLTLVLLKFKFEIGSDFINFVFGGRFESNSHIGLASSLIGIHELLFGFVEFNLDGDFSIGDNGPLLRIATVGMLVSILYTLSLSLVLISLVNKCARHGSRSFLYAFYSTIFFLEMGFTSFSQPGVVVMLFLPLIFLFRGDNEACKNV